MTLKILAFAGSTRTESFNKKLIKQAVNSIESLDVAVTLIDLRNYPLPLYDGDLEAQEGIPENGKRLKKLFMEHDGLLLACPEYNSSISAVLKNTIDWVSRPMKEESEKLICFKDKLALLLSASPGALGGIRGLVIVRMLLENIGTMVMPGQFCLPKAHEMFEDNGDLKDAKKQAVLRALLESYIEKLHVLKGG